MNATKKDAENFIQFLHDQPRMITQIKDQLSYDARIIARDKSYAGDWESIVSMRYNGKKWLVFDHYVVQVLPVYLTVTSSEDNTSIVLGDKEAGKLRMLIHQKLLVHFCRVFMK